MLDQLDFYRVGNDVSPDVQLNTAIYPISLFNPTVNERQIKDRPRMQQFGTWPTRSFSDSMTIECQGAILGNGPDDYVINRKALVNAFRPDPTVPVTERLQGTLHVLLWGETEEWLADVIVESFSAPIDAGKGDWDSSELMITFFSWLPYFVGSDTGNYYWWS